MKNYFEFLYEAIYTQSKQTSSEIKKDAKQQTMLLKQNVADIRSILRSFLNNNSPEITVVNDPANKTTKLKYEKLYQIEQVKSLVDKTTQGRQSEASILKYILEYINNYVLKGQKSTKIESRIIAIAERNFKEASKTQAMNSSFEGSGYSEDFKQFFPSKISFELHPSREVARFLEQYGNKRMTIQEKSNRVTFITKNYDSISRQVTKDIKSPDEDRKLSALMVGLIMTTGIRPGTKLGSANAKNEEGGYIIDDETKDKIKEETYGASTLKPEHIKFINDNIVFQFKGKMGSNNIAEIKSNLSPLSNIVVTELNKLYQTNQNEVFLFTDSRGRHIDYSFLEKYITNNWGGLYPTDFRKEVATREFYESVKNEWKQIVIKYNEMKIQGVESIENQIITNIIEILNKSVENVKRKLSHESGENTAIEQYIDPRIIIHFLNTLNLQDSYEDIIINNRNVVLNFDVNKFIEFIETQQ